MTGSELKSLSERSGVMEVIDRFPADIRVEIPLYQDFLDLPIEELNLSVRSFNGLMRARITSVKQLADALSEEYGLDHIRNLGKKSIAEIKRALLAESYERLTEAQKETFWQVVLERNTA